MVASPLHLPQCPFQDVRSQVQTCTFLHLHYNKKVLCCCIQPFSSNSNYSRAGWTMLISAYWHGLHAGYYLSFLTIPLCIAAETAMEASVRARLGPKGQNIFDWVHWFLKMRAYDYMCMGFVLLKASDTINYWSSIYFIIQIIALVCIGVGQIMKGGRKDRSAREKENVTREKTE